MKFQMPKKVLVISLLLTLAVWLPLFVIPPIEPALIKTYGLSYVQIGLLYSLPLLLLAVLAIPAGYLADTFGIRVTIGFGILTVVAGAVLRAAMSGYQGLLFCTALYGLGMALCLPNLPKLARRYDQAGGTEIVIAFMTMSSFAGSALSLVLTSLVYAATGSTAIVFFIWAIPALAVAPLWWILIKEPPREPRFHGNDKPDIARLSVVLKKKVLWLAAFIYLLHNIFFYTWVEQVTSFSRGAGASESLSGLITSVIFWAGIPGILFSVLLSARLGRRKPFILIPSAILALASFAMIYSSLSFVWLLLVVVGAAAATRSNTLISLPPEIVKYEHVGAAEGLVMSIAYLGAVIGPVVGGYILDSSNSLKSVFIFLAIVCTASLLVATALPETGNSAGVQGN